MAYLELLNSAVQELRSEIEKILDYTLEDICRTQELGSALGFADYTDFFNNLLLVMKELNDSKLESLPLGHLRILEQMVSQVRKNIHLLRDFKPSDGVGRRQELVDTAEGHWSAVYTTIANTIAFLNYQKISNLEFYDKIKVEFEKTILELSAKSQETIDLLDKAKSLYLDAQKEAGSKGISDMSIFFKMEADGHLKASKFWLAAVFLLGISVSTVVIWKVFPQIEAIRNIQPASKIVTLAAMRFTEIFPLLYLFILAGKNYAASRHNLIENRHRERSLSTFITFVKSAEDQETKDTILAQAAQAIFTAPSSGYLSKEGDGAQTNQIVEVGKLFAGK